MPTAALCYGHLPLMLTRACPLRNVRDCGKCPGGGTLRDRKGRDFTVTCSAPAAGVRTVFNPVPLYMGERLRELPVDVAVAAFTTETPPAYPRFWTCFSTPNRLTASLRVGYTIRITKIIRYR
ncbi:hypothetical protein NIA69_19885 [Gemmiger formicilis]|nr:hypothetical protein [Gemmiger formicilis]